jgi:hypothetical protein
MYTLRKLKQVSSTRNDKSDRSGSSCSSPTSSTLLQHEPSYLSDAAENPRHSRSSELQSSSLLKSFYLSPKLSRSPKTQHTQLSEIYLFCSLHILYYLFYLLPSPKNCLLTPTDLIFLLKRSVASSRSFSKTFSPDPIQSRIYRLATLIEHTSSMMAATISIPAHSSKESHAIFMQY